MTTTTAATSYDVRAQLEDLLERDLLGPWDGPHEELLPGTSPAERYLVGRLVPHRPPSAPPLEQERTAEQLQAEPEPGDDPALVDLETTGAAEEGDGEPETAQATRTGSMSASALGLSFRVADDVSRLLVEASWGRYGTALSEHQLTDQGRPRSVWKRTPAGGQHEIELSDGDAVPIVVDPDQDGVVLRVRVRRRDGARIVDLSLINGQPIPAGKIDEARLYQASLTVTALDGTSPVFVGHNDPELSPPVKDDDDERRHLSLLYRARREYAHGRQCAVDADVRPGDVRAWRLRTTCFPDADVALTVPGATETMPGLLLDMARLGSAELASDELVRALRPLVSGYRAWLDEQQDRLGDAEVQRYAPAGEHALATARDFADRLDRAVDLLRKSGLAREAFRFANQAMALQRVRSEVTRLRMSGDDTPLEELLRRLNVPAMHSWRPFQLAFVLLCLPGLTDPNHEDAHRGPGDDAQAQLLFFPTGGGKTEAYLGLTAYTVAIRRLQGVVGSGDEARDGSRGVAVLMRYTLRLLTAQQFQRAAALICACEWLRRERIDSGDGRWGTTPFRLGLWVGSKVTPNNFEEAKRQVEDARGADDALGGPLQLAACPWCGTRLGAGRDVTTDDVARRVRVFCGDPEGDCPYSRRRSPEGLPVLTVDEEVYRLTPDLIIATVDKFAQLPWKAATSTLFGNVDSCCERHGWRSPEFDAFCKPGGHPKRGQLPGARPESALRLRPPDLIIQDELHLISDALGSMVGLYETLIDDLCTRTVAGKPIRPVLVASTATVRRARDQVEQVFARDLAVFPPQVLDAGETFFSRVVAPSPSTPSRRYRGICATGERLKAIEIRVVSAALEHAQALFDRHGAAADPYMTLVDYFTSTRELAGMRRLVEDDIADRLSSLRVTTRRRRPTVSELTSRMPSSRIASTLADLEQEFDPAQDSTAALEELRRNGGKGLPPRRAMPLDVLLATSMLQVGVDVQRLGLMVVTGQPKNTAEYIQATSRVGRDTRRPGLVLTVYQWSRPRDLGHYEAFAYDHTTFGMRVEGLTTTPFSERALDRGLTAVVAAAVRHAGTSGLPNEGAGSVDLTTAAARLIAQVGARARRVTHDEQGADLAEKSVRDRLERWGERRRKLQTGGFGYAQAPDITGLLRKPDDGTWDRWTAPMSLREVEPEVLLQLQSRDLSVDEAPDWDYTRPETSS